MGQSTYEIHMRSPLPSQVVDQFAGATFTKVDRETLLLTVELDQEGLHLLVGQLRDLGIELLELRHVGVTSDDDRTTDDRTADDHPATREKP